METTLIRKWFLCLSQNLNPSIKFQPLSDPHESLWSEKFQTTFLERINFVCSQNFNSGNPKFGINPNLFNTVLNGNENFRGILLFMKTKNMMYSFP